MGRWWRIEILSLVDWKDRQKSMHSLGLMTDRESPLNFQKVEIAVEIAAAVVVVVTVAVIVVVVVVAVGPVGNT